jgi:hypothetical protein
MIYREPAEMIKETRTVRSTSSIVKVVGFFLAMALPFGLTEAVLHSREKPVIKEVITLDPGLCRDTVENHYWSGAGSENERTVCTNPKQSAKIIKWWDNGTALIKCSCRGK